MKRVLIAVFGAILTTQPLAISPSLLFAGEAKKETVYYDASGRIAGRCVRHGERTVCFDGSGRISSKAVTRDGKTVYFDGAGRIVGRSSRSR